MFLRWHQFQVLSKQAPIDFAHVLLDPSNVHPVARYHAHLTAQNIQGSEPHGRADSFKKRRFQTAVWLGQPF